MTAPLLTKARGSATSDDGFALAVVLGMAAFLTVMALGGLYLAQQASHEAATVRSESQAFQSANAGIDMAVARLTAHGFQTADYPITLTTAELSSGSAQVNMTKVDDYEFRCVSVRPRSGRHDRNGDGAALLPQHLRHEHQLRGKPDERRGPEGQQQHLRPVLRATARWT